MKVYTKRLVELAALAFGAGVTEHVARNGFDLSAAGLKGLFFAGAVAVYGLVVKGLGEKDRPTVK